MDLLELSAFLGNFGEFIGAVAVVITLIYLAAQVKTSKEATLANTHQIQESRKLALVENYMRRSERVGASYRDGALSDEISRLLFKASHNWDEMNEFERFRVREWSCAHIHLLDAQHFQYQHGLLEEEAYTNLQNALRTYAPIWRLMNIQAPRESFREEIDQVLSNLESGSD